MGMNLVATVPPTLTAPEYLRVVDHADARSLATAAFKADYRDRDGFGDDSEFGATAADRWPTAIPLSST